MQRIEPDRTIGSGQCLNCGAVLAGPYCAQCGQKTPHIDVTLRDFLHEATHELIHWEGRIPHTLKALFLSPGLLTRDFLDGRRARWLAPLRVYLICSLAFFVSRPMVEAITHGPVRQIAKINITGAGAGATFTPEERTEMAKSWPGRIFGPDRIERAASDSARLNHAVESALPKEMFALLPLFALLTSLAWRRAQPRYPAHLYLALHLHAVWFGLLAVSTVTTAAFGFGRVGAVAGYALLAYAVWYGLAALRRVFNESWPKTIAKSAGVAVMYGVCLFVMSIVMLGYVIATM